MCVHGNEPLGVQIFRFSGRNHAETLQWMELKPLSSPQLLAVMKSGRTKQPVAMMAKWLNNMQRVPLSRHMLMPGHLQVNAAKRT